MVPTYPKIAAALYGAYRLARFDGAGMQYFQKDPSGFYQSFFAAVLVAPLYALLLALDFTPRYGEAGVAVFDFVVVETSAYVIAWCAFPIIMLSVCRIIQRQPRYIGFVVAYNWASVLQNAVYLGIELLAAVGLMGDDVAAFLSLVALGAIVFYGWFIAKTALDLPGGQAIGIVVIDFLIGMIIHGTAGMILLD